MFSESTTDSELAPTSETYLKTPEKTDKKLTLT